MKPKEKYVKIVKSSKSTYWYAESIGDVFEVLDVGGLYHIMMEEKCLISVYDCVDCDENGVENTSSYLRVVETNKK